MTQAKLAQTIKLITVLASVLLFALVCVIGYQYIRMGTLSNRSVSLDRKISELSVTESNLRNGIEARKDPSYVEQQARENLGMIRVNGEVVYIVG